MKKASLEREVREGGLTYAASVCITDPFRQSLWDTVCVWEGGGPECAIVRDPHLAAAVSPADIPQLQTGDF